MNASKLFLTAALIGINAIAIAQTPEKKSKALVMKFTETWCGPCGSWGWDLANDLIPQLEGKGFFWAVMESSDPVSMNSNCSSSLLSNYQVGGFPTFIVKDVNGGVDASSIMSYVNQINTASTVASPAANVAISGNKINVTAKTKFWEAANGEYYMNAFVVEDSVLAEQNGQSGIVAHHHLLRGSMMANKFAFGESIVNGAVAANQEFTKTFSMDIASGWKIPKLEVYIVIFKKEGSKYKFVNIEKGKFATTGINTLSETASLQLYPNPAVNQVSISIFSKKALNANLSITDALGRQVYTQENLMIHSGKNDMTINTQTFGSGIYNMNIMTNEGAIHNSFIVQK